MTIITHGVGAQSFAKLFPGMEDIHSKLTVCYVQEWTTTHSMLSEPDRGSGFGSDQLDNAHCMALHHTIVHAFMCRLSVSFGVNLLDKQ